MEDNFHLNLSFLRQQRLIPINVKCWGILRQNSRQNPYNYNKQLNYDKKHKNMLSLSLVSER